MRARKKGDMYLGKVSNYINQNMAKFKQIYIRYVASIFCVFIIAVVSIIANQKKGFDIESIVTVCSIWLAGNFLVESLWKKTAEEAQKNKRKWLIGYGVTFVIAIVFENLSEILKAQKADIPNLIFESILYFYIACTVLLAIYVLLRQQQLDLPHCIGRIIFALLRAVGVYLVLNIAVILILEIIDALLVDIDTFRVELNIQLMLSALAYFPTCLLAVSDTSEDNAAFTKKFVSYVLLPCVWIAMFVIYLYVVKIFVTQEVPSNEIFSICASLFAIGMPIWMMASGFVEENSSRYKKLIHITKYIYAPFILLEIYSMSVRVKAYGLTEQRYAACIFIHTAARGRSCGTDDLSRLRRCWSEIIDCISCDIQWQNLILIQLCTGIICFRMFLLLHADGIIHPLVCSISGTVDCAGQIDIISCMKLL